MKRIQIERVVLAVNRLQHVRLTRGGQWLPGFLCLKSDKLAVGKTVSLRGKDFFDFISQFYSVPSPPDPDKPFFDPLQTPPWRNSNWPQGTFHSRSDRSLLVAQGALEVSPQARERTYTLQSKYISVLPSYFEDEKRIPILDFACWMFRNEPFGDEDTAQHVVERLIKTLGLSKPEVAALFDHTADLEEDNLFTKENWPLEALTKHLPLPASRMVNAALPPEIEEEESEDGQLVLADNETFVSALLAQMQDVDNFEVDRSFLRAVLAAMRVDRFVILCGKPGTGKTEFVHSLHRALAHVLRGTSEVFLVHHEVHPETAEWELLGARDLGGTYVPSPFMHDLTTRGTDSDLHIVLLDEMNRGPVDSYAGRLLAAISNRVSLDLPGQVMEKGFPTSGRWEPRPGVVLFGAINSPLTEPSRLPLSGPVKRRAHLLPMPDLLEQLATASREEEARAQFLDLCKRRLVPQLRQRLLRRGTAPALDGDLDVRLASPPSDEILLHIWKVVVAVGKRVEVAITVGVVQSILAFVLAFDQTDHLEALDRAFVSKVIPHLQGDAGVLDAIEAALGEGFGRSRTALEDLRAYAEENGGRVNPVY